MRGLIITFGLFVILCAGVAAVTWYYAVVGDANVEQGAWAMRLRIVEVFFIAVGAGSVLLLVDQIRLLLEQTRAASEAANAQLEQTNRWNRRRSYHEFFPELPQAVSRKAFNDLAAKLKIDEHEKGEELKTDVCKMLMEPANKRIVTDFLNDFEEFAGAVRRELVEDQYAYDLESQRVQRAWKVFQPFVKEMRAQSVYADAYTELESLANTWEQRTVNNRPRPVVTPT